MNLELNAIDHRTLVLLWGLLGRNARHYEQNLPGRLREEIAALEAKQARARSAWSPWRRRDEAC